MRVTLRLCSRGAARIERKWLPAAGRRRSYPTKRALERFLASLTARSQPLLLDLGPVIGTNVTFFGEELGCKILVENLFKDIDRHVAESKLDELPAFFEQRFPQEDGSVDGILCWDMLRLRRAAGGAGAGPAARADTAARGGSCWPNSATVEPVETSAPTYTKYVVVDRHTLQYRPYAAPGGKQRPIANRDIQRMFEPLRDRRPVPAEEQPPRSPVPQSRRAGAAAHRPEPSRDVVRPVIALLTDFGTRDHYVGAMRGVMLGICPDASLVDITHEIDPQDVLGGALELAAAFRYFPAGTVFLSVVDPGVGSARAESGGRSGRLSICRARQRPADARVSR